MRNKENTSPRCLSSTEVMQQRAAAQGETEARMDRTARHCAAQRSVALQTTAQQRPARHGTAPLFLLHIYLFPTIWTHSAYFPQLPFCQSFWCQSHNVETDTSAKPQPSPCQILSQAQVTHHLGTGTRLEVTGGTGGAGTGLLQISPSLSFLLQSPPGWII